MTKQQIEWYKIALKRYEEAVKSGEITQAEYDGFLEALVKVIVGQ